MTLFREEAVVLRTYRLGEADRIVVLLSRGRGKVRAVAKGVRRTTSKFGSRLEPGSHVAVQFHEGRDLHIVTQTESVETFRRTRGDLDRIEKVAAVLEAVDHLAQEGHPEPGLYRRTVGVLRTIETRPGPYVVPAFLVKLLGAEGVGLVVGECVSCGGREGLVALDVALGGATCGSCRSGVPVAPAALQRLGDILGGRLNAVLDAGDDLTPTEADTAREVGRVAQLAFEAHVDRRLRAVRAAAPAAGIRGRSGSV